MKPFLEALAVYDIRERVVTTSAVDDGPTGETALKAQSKEGLSLGLSVSVRYRLDPQRLDAIHIGLGESLEREVVPSHVASAFRQLVPRYMVAREVKAAEAQAQVRVLQAKAEADAMQHTLPLKEKQIQQSRLEAEARKEATLMNADAAAQAKVIDSKAELERLNRLADAEAHRIRVTSEADLDKMRVEAVILKENPLLIQKIVAERLSDKMQIMMVPMDGSNFFASEVFRSSAFLGGGGTAPATAASPTPGTKTVAARR